MALNLYNTLTKQVEPFTPIAPDRVTFYTCGPTVYDYAHIGNFRSFLAADVLRRYLESPFCRDGQGYQVDHVMNMTDVGHMTDDEAADGGGQDKMEVARERLASAKKSGELPPGVDLDPTDPLAVAGFYIDAFLGDSKRLGLKVALEHDARPEHMPRPTAFIQDMIELVQALIDEGHAYVGSDGVVYYDVQSYPQYGRLSGNTLATLREGAGGRVSTTNQAVKRHPADFMLWKPDQTHLMRWPSPWGEGYPGWHLECSVMARSILGSVIDLHSGGEDNIFPHHDCEIAQSCGVSGEQEFARHWFHPRHLFVEGAKMSKSAGTFFTVSDLLSQGFSPAAIRMELIKTHYRSNANFTMQGLRDSSRMVEKWDTARHQVAKLSIAWLDRSDGVVVYDDLQTSFAQFMNDDLNVAGAIGVVNTAVNRALALEIDPAKPLPSDEEVNQRLSTWRTHQGDDDMIDLFDAIGPVLGVFDVEMTAPQTGNFDEVMIESLISARAEARAARDFGRADSIRDELAAMGVEIVDTAEGTTWRPAQP